MLVFAAGRMITVLGGMEPESAEMCLYMLTAITVVKPIVWTLAFIPAYGMRAAGDVAPSMIAAFRCGCWCVVLGVYLCRARDWTDCGMD